MGNKILLFMILSGSVLLWSCSDDDDDANGQDPPEACFEVVGASVKAGDEITFTNCSKNATVYAWDFGDGTTWTQENTTLETVEGATVDLYRNRDSFDSGQPDLTATSDENGKVVFNDLETNTYLMVVTKDDLSNIKEGFVISGVFQSQEEIDNAEVQPGNPKPGDFRFMDLNRDGIISDDDKADYGILDYKGELIEREIVIGKL